MYNLCYGMKYINITQLPGGSYSHPNQAMDLAGEDSGIDVWRAIGYWKCTAVNWGYHTCFFVSCDPDGQPAKVRCADGRDRIITMALTHSDYKYVTPKVNKVYAPGSILYEEGSYGHVTGNHIHLEIAQGVQTKKRYDPGRDVYVMNNELNPLRLMFVWDQYSTVINSKGKELPRTYSDVYIQGVEPGEPKEMKLYLYATKDQFAIRGGLTFSGGKATAPVVHLMKKGQKAAIIAFTERFEQDGYEWAQVEIEVDREKKKGWAQLDTRSYLIKAR